ncbi:50S ribosomal protein L25/general stress protein Ctc [Motiliproteus coralliicola]|uniref:Large ribosomal subunit protein bL25 n=1 Tax=Motiliproteus coralliicola TaxID=2283196 RepID=A0A369W909_9GAMM|nr:50S ribosomal protein L25/general stress protein Ctc [Motiliproteus coralliicola]RDE18137.1 50S ribosomal protein L25/general stress protein Ctc [Motiliproteus coralliicola]
MSEFTLNAQARNDLGKGASRRLRREAGLIPAVIYGGKEEPQSITLEHKAIIKAAESESFFSSLLTLSVDGAEQKVILKDLQRHPAKQLVLHADFQRAVNGETFTITVPLHFINEDKCSAIKLGGKASHIVNQVEIACTPETLPEFLSVDMQNVEVGQIVHLSDVQLPEGVEIPSLKLGADHNQPVATIARKRGS